MLVRRCTGKTLIRLLLQKQPDLVLHCLCRPFLPTCSIQNFRTFNVDESSGQPPVALVVVILLFIVSCCSHCLWGFCVRSLFCFVVLCVLSSFAIISTEKRGLVASLLLCSECHVAVIAL